MSGGEAIAMATLTLRVGVVAIALAFLPALGLGLWLARREFRGKALVEAVIALPMLLPPVAVGLGLLLLFGRRGPFFPLLHALGVELPFTWWAAALAAALVGFPFLARACEQAFADVEPRFEQLARSLGYTRASTFFRVTLPLARRGVLYGTVLAFTRGLGEFGATAVVAGIQPGRTETLALGIWSRIQLGDDSGALALCAASFALALAATTLAEGWLRRAPRAGVKARS
ncbi:MAG TPA: molybdate ABC transporter permease subunit [Myxococcota bacterium]|nr:molybdate ABC transporter permease subunit [Myxococcota bacterium]